MDRVSSSPPSGTAPTIKGRCTSPQVQESSPTCTSGFASAQRKGSNFNTAASFAASQSPFLSPGDGGDGLTLQLSPSGPSSEGPTHALATSTSATTTTGDDEHDDITELSHTRQQFDTSTNKWERALRAREAEVAHLRRTVQELSGQLNDALHTLDARADAAAELQAMKDESAAAAERRDDAVRSVRLEMLESRVKYRSMEDELAAKYDGDVQAKATALLTTRTKEVYDENFKLLKEKLLLAQEVAAYRATNKELEDSYKKLRRETDLDVDARQQLLERSVQQKSQIAALRQQVKTCEDSLNAVVCEYDKKLAEQERQHQTVVSNLTKERDDARRDALRLKRELGQLRSAAGNVLSQRSDVDDFFYAALDEVRRRVVEERRQGLTVGGSSGAAASQGERSTTTSLRGSPAQTATSLLRLETTERLLLTGSLPGTTPTAPAAAASSSLPANWTTYRKGLPKHAVGASARQTAGPAGSSLPPVATTSRGSHSSPPAVSLDGTGTLVAVPGATPAYLRTDVDAAAASMCTSATAAWNTTSVSQQQQQHLPPPRSLPHQPTWKDVKDVDVTSLSWADKERVIQILFKRIQEERRHRGKEAHAKATASSQSGGRKNTASPVKVDVAQFDRDGDSSTFLTQT